MRVSAAWLLERLAGADKAAHELPVNLWRDGLHIESLILQKGSGIFGSIDAGGFDVDVVKAGRRQLRFVLDLFERSGHASHPHQNALPDLGRDFTARHNVGHGEAAAGLENPEGLGENPVLIRRKIDDAVRDDDVHGVVGEWDVLDFAFQKLDVADAGLALVFVRESQHFIGHIQTVRFSGGPYAPRGKQHIDAAAGAKVQNGLAGFQFRQSGWIAAAEGRQDSGLRELPGLLRVVQVAGYGITAMLVRRGGTAATASAAGDAQGGLSILLLHDLFYFHISIIIEIWKMSRQCHETNATGGKTAGVTESKEVNQASPCPRGSGFPSSCGGLRRWADSRR
ncbi:hypothetical protein SBA3_1470011 [Candidatus Sulfopaludibacter sp. SbA3]|nr:hypothetical protein SBA3_1470011 [Candidatus Sulfopaludibacter sp. SbA3]